mmetsp:Transcript_12371/g.14915  ORF Transcript_12371/g.14915 Transcript_12371/m.14915 type:complete len:316 (-) Transcript_12371:110-1057(-)|eukprot:CAMPEP_0195282966 /NCGR_PEP_ID=MMETSP0707-20130614/1667_1 /TAXON_ID=33640 /ORGANISM="Asterionellopsis glacialis, Strain CCMP134" /LENGTH=315 /DNA_ID=CAMNT_0040342053 /DNA_START=65 /DNA_END=1012 /DNA_ORIENTATION=+
MTIQKPKVIEEVELKDDENAGDLEMAVETSKEPDMKTQYIWGSGPLQGVGAKIGCLRDRHLRVTFFSIAFLIFLVLFSICKISSSCPFNFFDGSPLFWGVFTITSLCFICETLCSNTFTYLRNINTSETLMELMDRLYKQKPNVTWSIQCYHYETRTREVTEQDSDGHTHTRTETYEERVNTHSAQGMLKYVGWSDVSTPLNQANIEEYQMTKVSLKKEWIGDEGCNEQRSNFISSNNRDTHYDFSENLCIEGFTPRVLSFVDIAERPCLADWRWFLISHATVVFALPYRMWFSSRTGKVRTKVVKKIVTSKITV